MKEEPLDGEIVHGWWEHEESVSHGSWWRRKCDEGGMVAVSDATEESRNVRTEGYPCAWQLVNVKSAVTMQIITAPLEGTTAVPGLPR